MTGVDRVADLSGALRLATALTDARATDARILWTPEERALARDLAARLSARVAAAYGEQPPEHTPTGPGLNGKAMYSVAETRELLDLKSDKQVRRLIHSNQLRARNTGHSYHIPAEAITEYLNGGDTPIASAS
jgi:excisionase family DNA binding protein